MQNTSSYSKDKQEQETLLRNQLEAERQTFEENSFKALKILQQKDETIVNLQKLLNNERVQHLAAKNALLQANTELNSKRSDISTSSSKFSPQELEQQKRKLVLEAQQLRERCIDQSEQIQVLVHELSKLRDASPPSDFAKEEIHHLKSELEALKKRLIIAPPSHQLRDEWLTERAVEGGVSISTPLNYAVSHTNANESSHSQQGILLQEKLVQAEYEIQRLTNILAEVESSALDLRERLDESGCIISVMKTEEKEIKAENEQLKQQIESLESRVLESAQYIKASTPEALAHSKDMSHTWWKYVWHECQRLGRERKVALQQLNGDAPELDSIRTQQHQAEKMADSVRVQAVELITTRQESLGQQLRHRQEVETLRNETEELRQECVQLKSKLRFQQRAKETKITEMAATIRSLSLRSALHTQLAECRQDLEAERLVTSHLRFEMEEYRGLMEEEQRRVIALRKETFSLQGTLDNLAVLKTVLSPSSLSADGSNQSYYPQHAVVGGPNPAALIEVMSGETRRLHRELEVKDMELSDCKKNLNELEEVVEKYKEQFLLAKPTSQFHKVRNSFDNVGRADNCNDNKEEKRNHNADSESKSRNQDEEKEMQYHPNRNTRARDGNVADVILDYQPMSINVDRDATPKMVLESLDAVLLRDRIQLQDIILADMRQQLQSAIENPRSEGLSAVPSEILPEEVVKFIREAEHEQSALKEDNLVSLRLRSLLQVQLDEAKSVATAARKENEELQQELFRAMAEQQRQDLSSFPSARSTNEISEEESSACDAAECLRIKHMLKERTAQLQVTIDTLDALNSADVETEKIGSTRSNHQVTGPSYAEDLFNLASQPMASQDDNGPSQGYRKQGSAAHKNMSVWGYQLLVKRIVQLTAELCSQTASLHMTERRAGDLQSVVLEKAKIINSMKTQLKDNETIITKLKSKATELINDSAFTQREHMVKFNSLQSENKELIAALRELQAKYDTQEVLFRQSKESLNAADDASVEDWIRGVHEGIVDAVVTRLSEQGNFGMNLSYGQEEKEPEITTIKSLLSKFIADLGHTRAMREDGSINSSNMQIFLQRITDMVLSCSKVATTVSIQQRETENELRRSVISLHSNRELAKLLAVRLLQTKRRASIGEKAVLNAFAGTAMMSHKNALEGILRGALSQARAERDLVVRMKTKNKKTQNADRQVSLGGAESLEGQIKLLQQQAFVAEQESRGSVALRAKEAAIQSIEERFVITEKNLKKWIQTELPRIVSGLPLTEDATGDKENSNGHFTEQLVAASGLDKNYALSQALCVAKASQVIHEAKIATLEDKISILKERNVELEGVLLRWKDEVNYSSILSQSLKDRTLVNSDNSEGGGVMTLEDILNGKYSKDVNYSHQPHSGPGDALTETGTISIERMHKLSDRVIELEEERARQNSETAQLLAEKNSLKEMVDVLLEDENSIKVKSTRQMTQIRSDLEIAHSQELLRLKQAYEQDRQQLLQELKDIGRAVEDAHVLTSSGGYGDASSSEVDQSRAFNNSIQKHIEAIESEFSTSRSTQSEIDVDNILAVSGEHKPQPIKVQLIDKQTATDHLVTLCGVATQANLPSDTSAQQAYENGLKMDKRGVDTDEDDSGSSESIKDVYFDNLERLLAIEKRKNEEVRGEVSELETLLSIQKLAFEQHLDGVLPMTDTRTARSAIQQMDSYAQTDIPSKLALTTSTQTSKANDFIIDDHFHNENQDLWPSELELLIEMLTLLKTGYSHLISGRSDHAMATIQAASAMGSRLKILLSKERKAILLDGRLSVGNDSFATESTSFNLDLRNLNNKLESMVSNYRTLSNGEIQEDEHDIGRMEKSDTADENVKLQRRVIELETLIHAARESQVAMEEDKERCISSLHHTYEKALFDANSAMDATTAAAKEEIDRLQSCISQLKTQIRDVQNLSEAAERRIVLEHSLTEQQQRRRPREGGGGDTTSGSSYNSESDAELTTHKRNRNFGNKDNSRSRAKEVEDTNLNRCQDELARAAADLARSQELLRWTNSSHDAELQNLKDQFNRFKLVQNDIVNALEKQLVDITVLHSMRGGNSSEEDLLVDSDDGKFGDDDRISIHPILSLQDAEEKIVKLAALYKLKKLELQTVLMSLSRIGDDSGNAIITTQSLASAADREEEKVRTVRSGGLLDSSSASTLEYPNVVVQPLYPPLYRTLLSPRTQNLPSPERGRSRDTTPRPTPRSKSVDSGRKADVATSRSRDLRPSRNSSESREKDLQYSLVRQEMLSARVAAAERRIDYLQRTLTQEKGVSMQLRTNSQHQKQQIAQLQLQIERLKISQKEEAPRAQPAPQHYSSENLETDQLIESVGQFLLALDASFNTVIDPGDVGNSQRLLNRVQKLGQAADELRRDALHFTRSLLDHLQHWIRIAKNNNYDQSVHKEPATGSAAPSAAMTALKEELSRKSKLLVAIKAARAADVNALEQWKGESKKLEENCKRLQRSLDTKDNYLKDLKAKIAALEDKDKDKDGAGGSSSSDLAALSAAELRTRLRSSELERTRGRNRLQVLKDKITELEGNVSALQTDNERQKRAAAVVTELRLSLARKDDVIAGLKAQLERAQTELQQLKFLDAAQQVEGQKKIRQLQRQVDGSRRDFEELEKEADLMRRRLVSGAPLGQPNLSSTWTAQRSSQQPQPELVAPVYMAVPPIRPFQSSQDLPTVPSAGNSVNSLPLLGLDREVSQDLQDVLASLNLNLDTQSFSNSGAYATGTYSNSSRSRSGGVQSGVGIAGSDRLTSRTSLDDQRISGQDREGSFSDEDDEDETSVEKRLKALVGAALRSPSHRRSSRDNTSN